MKDIKYIYCPKLESLTCYVDGEKVIKLMCVKKETTHYDKNAWMFTVHGFPTTSIKKDNVRIVEPDEAWEETEEQERLEREEYFGDEE